MKNRGSVLFDVLVLIMTLVALAAIALPQYAKSQTVLVMGEELQAIEAAIASSTDGSTATPCDGKRYRSERGYFSCKSETLPTRPQVRFTALSYYGEDGAPEPLAILRRDWGGLIRYENPPLSARR